MLEHLYPIFILTGATIAAVLLYLWLQARNANHLSLALIRLNEQLQFDMPVFLRNAWPVLAHSGVRGITWKLDWFGISMEGSAGKTSGASVHREIEVGEMKLSIDFQQSQYNERRYFDEALIETFLLLLRTDMWIKAGTIDATFSQMSKLTLFLQHDMKNVAQFIQLMSDQLATVPAGKEQQILDYLRAAAPLIRHRADHIVRTLTIGQSRENPLRQMQLHEELSQICKLYHLDCTITGNAQISVPENTLDGALDNILKNYHDINLREAEVKPHVFITIQDNESDIKINISAKNTPPVSHFERLFEPFWSSDPAGLGIGLYQTKQMLRICNGVISVGQSETGQLQFLVHVTK
ncbi:sensor histidine kinase [Undibacterium sp. Di26W]|uniref:sensor histidine kinase n=1 Tax=Undibacterium sp. Di26W TaxID=3413035 RepID=UPI003BF1562E